jgi:transposase
MSVFTNTIGIDVSKDKLDAHDYKLNKHHLFKNTLEGYKKLVAWVQEKHENQLEGILFCFEHTGIYSLGLSCFMEENKIAYSVIAGLEIKRSMGITRGKNDKIDSFKIAEYAYLRREQIQVTQLPTKSILKLKELLTIREKMVKHRVAYKNHLKGLSTFYERENDTIFFESQENLVEELSKQIKLIEGEMHKLIEQEPAIKQNYELATSVKGVGLILGANMLVLSDNFRKFKTWREFASYAGIAPFEHSSGSSIKSGKKISNLANKGLKSLLSNSAVVSIQHNAEMRQYYEKRVKEGKNNMSVINIVRNKVVARVFAVVKRGTPYVETLGYAA